MAIVGQDNQVPGDRGASQFPEDSVLGRLQRGNYKPNDTDLDELRKLAKIGNRAERRAAGRFLKKHGMKPPEATPKAPIVKPAEPPESVTAPSRQQRPAAQRPPVKQPAAQPQAAKPEVARATPKKAAPAKAAPAKAAAKKPPAKKAAVKKTAAKQPAAKKTAAKKTRAKKAAPKKAGAKKAAPKKAAAKKTTRRR